MAFFGPRGLSMLARHSNPFLPQSIALSLDSKRTHDRARGRDLWRDKTAEGAANSGSVHVVEYV